MSQVPNIVVDRALGHYFDSFEVDSEAMGQFYDTLDVKNKPPLEDCIIYYSALAAYDFQRGTTGYGVAQRNPAKARSYDPQGPPANITMFVGSTLKNGNIDQLSEFTAHELVHYANHNNAPARVTKNEQELALELSLLKGRISRATFIGGVAFFSGGIYGIGLLEHQENPLIALGGGVTLQIVRRLIHHKSRNERAAEIRRVLFDTYAEHGIESEARMYAEQAGCTDLVRVSLAATKYGVLTRATNAGSSVTNRLVDKFHRGTSLGQTQYIKRRKTN